jgi:hypothetical protein
MKISTRERALNRSAIQVPQSLFRNTGCSVTAGEVISTSRFC